MINRHIIQYNSNVVQSNKSLNITNSITFSCMYQVIAITCTLFSLGIVLNLCYTMAIEIYIVTYY